MVERFSRRAWDWASILILSSETTQFNVSARGLYQEIIDKLLQPQLLQHLNQKLNIDFIKRFLNLKAAYIYYIFMLFLINYFNRQQITPIKMLSKMEKHVVLQNASFWTCAAPDYMIGASCSCKTCRQSFQLVNQDLCLVLWVLLTHP